MKKLLSAISVLTCIVMICILIMPVSAETIIIDDKITTSTNYDVIGDQPITHNYLVYMTINNAKQWEGNITLVWFGKIITDNATLNAQSTTVSMLEYPSNNHAGEAIVSYYRGANGYGYVTLEANFKPPTDGTRTYNLRGDGMSVYQKLSNLQIEGSNLYAQNLPADAIAAFRSLPSAGMYYGGAYTFNLHKNFKQTITVGEYDDRADSIDILRNIDGKVYSSLVIISSKSGEYYNATSLQDISYIVPNTERPYQILVDSLVGNAYKYDFYSPVIDNPEQGTVKIYIRNSQTYDLISNAYITIEASVSGNLHPVVNETVPSGVYQIELQPTGGGQPNPDFYRLTTTAEGYSSLNPYMDFEVSGATTIYDYLYPLAGAPEDENKTFVDFYVRDLSANAISGATVNFGGYTLKTNSAGYAVFEVEKDNTYSYQVSKTGYMTIEGIATIGSDDRYTVNVALMVGAVPTQTIVTPTITSPTPSQTTPPIQEDNIIGMSVRGLAKGFGLDYDTALLLFGLMIIFGAGGIVMNSVKGGAMEFIAGSIVGTFVAFALGLIPIWIFIIIAVVFGAYVLRVFLQGGQ